MKKVLTGIMFFLIFFAHVLTAEAKNINARFEMEAGARVSLSSVSSSTHAFYKPFLLLGCGTDFFGIYAGYSRYFEYRIIDTLYNERFIGLNKITLDVDIYPVEGLLAGVEVNYYIGESKYQGTDVVIDLGYDFKKFSVYGEFSYNLWEYTIRRVNINNESYDIYLEGAYFINDDFSVDLSYDHLYTSSDELSLEIRNNIFRAGLMKGFKDIVYLMGGIGLGWSSSDYFIASVDAGISVYPWKYIRISAFYMYSYSYDTLAGTGNVSYADSAYVSDTSYSSHRLSIGLSFAYR